MVLGTALAAVASWLFSWPEQQALATVLGETVGQPVDPLAGLAWLWTGAVLAWLRPRNAIGWLLLVVGGFQLIQNAAAAYGSMGIFAASPDWPAAHWAAWLGTALWIPGFLPLANILVALYPDGRLPSPRWRWPVGATVVGTVMLTVIALLSDAVYYANALGESPLSWSSAPRWLAIACLACALVLEVGGTLAIWGMSAVRLVHLGSPQRQQLAWLLCVVVGLFVLGTVGSMPDWTRLVTISLLPVAIGVGVFRYNLLGIQVVLRRGLVYGALTAVVMGIYLLVTAVAGSSAGRGPLPGVLAAAVVAVGLTPLRERLQRGVDRLVYGDRRDPIRAVTQLADQVASADEQDLLRAVLASITAAVHAPGAAVLAPDGRELASIGAPGPGPTFTLTVSAREVGTLMVAAPSTGEAYGTDDLRLLRLLAPQTAVVVRALDLADALQVERDRVVAATGQERDRLRCDLHDGLGPSLSGVGLGLAAVEDALAADDPPSAGRMVTRLRWEVAAAVGEVRRIIDDLRPSRLDGAGLAAAVRQHAAAAGFPVEVTVSTLPALRPDVETAAYRITTEALTNVGKHAHASRAHVDLCAAAGILRVQVADDGTGFPVMLGRAEAADGTGVGLASMRHRTQALGGELCVDTGSRGTTITATLPLDPR